MDPEDRSGHQEATGTNESEPETPVAPGAAEAPVECRECGAAAEPDAKYCVRCSAPLPAGGEEKEREPGDMEPWALKAGQAISKIPRKVKIGVPVALLAILVLLVVIFVLAATHSQRAAIGRYCGSLKVSDYKAAYDLTSHPGGEFSSFDYFQKWQNTTTGALGPLESFAVRQPKDENTLFGRILGDEPAEGDAYVVTMRYRKKAFDVRMVVLEAGGAWPFKRWKIKLSHGNTRLLVAPLGADIVIDGKLVGKAEENEDLKEALNLSDFPDDIGEAVDYARNLVKAFEFLFAEFKILVRNLDTVTSSAQGVVDKFGASGYTWADILDAANTTVAQSKSFGQDVARLAMHVYWIFGGGNDGTTRARLTRAQTGLDTSNLPEGYHEVTARLPGLQPDTVDFVAPDEVEIELDPTRATRNALRTTMTNYYGAIANAAFTVDASGLYAVVGGDLLDEETNRVGDLAAKGQHVASDLTSIRLGEYTMLAADVATLEANETWNFNTFQGTTLASSVSGVKYHMLYTLQEQGGGLWKVIERKKL